MKFNRLTFIEEVSPPVGKSNRYKYWKCLCDCGTNKVLKATVVRNSIVKSCGCLREEKARKVTSKRNTKHGNAKREKEALPTFRGGAC